MQDSSLVQPLTCHSDEAQVLYRTALEQMLGSESGAADNLDRALQLDPEFALAAAARYSVAKDSGEAGRTGSASRQKPPPGLYLNLSNSISGF